MSAELFADLNPTAGAMAATAALAAALKPPDAPTHATSSVHMGLDWSEEVEREEHLQSMSANPLSSLRRVQTLLRESTEKHPDDAGLRDALLVVSSMIDGYALAMKFLQPSHPPRATGPSYAATVSRSTTQPTAGIRPARPRPGPPPPTTDAQRRRAEALRNLRSLRPFEPRRHLQIYLSAKSEEDKAVMWSYLKLRLQLSKLLARGGGRLDFLRRLPSGDALMQIDQKGYDWLKQKVSSRIAECPSANPNADNRSYRM